MPKKINVVAILDRLGHLILDLNHLDNAEEDLLNRCKNERTKTLFTVSQ